MYGCFFFAEKTINLNQLPLPFVPGSSSVKFTAVKDDDNSTLTAAFEASVKLGKGTSTTTVSLSIEATMETTDKETSLEVIGDIGSFTLPSVPKLLFGKSHLNATMTADDEDGFKLTSFQIDGTGTINNLGTFTGNFSYENDENATFGMLVSLPDSSLQV